MTERDKSGSRAWTLRVVLTSVGVGSLVASAFSRHALDAYGISLLTVSACFVTPRLVTGAFAGRGGDEESDEAVLKLGADAADGVAKRLWEVSRREVIYPLTALSAALLAAAIINSLLDPHSHTTRTLVLAAFGYPTGLLAVALASVGAVIGKRDQEDAVKATQRWLRSPQPAVLLGSLTFLAATGIQLLATFRKH